MDQSIDSIGETDSFSAAESAISEWEKALADSETTMGEILRLQEELEILADEERSLVADDALNEGAAAKKLNEIRARKELKLVKLESAKCNLVSGGAGGRGLEITNRLSALQQKRDSMVAEREMILNRLNSHTAEEVQRQLGSLIGQLIKKREAEADRLLDSLLDVPCVDRKGGAAWASAGVSDLSVRCGVCTLLLPIPPRPANYSSRSGECGTLRHSRRYCALPVSKNKYRPPGPPKSPKRSKLRIVLKRPRIDRPSRQGFFIYQT